MADARQEEETICQLDDLLDVQFQLTIYDVCHFNETQPTVINCTQHQQTLENVLLRPVGSRHIEFYVPLFVSL